MPKNWNRRFKYNREKIKTGDVFELAEVVRNLAIREMEKGLSTGEKQMYTRAKKILASEFMYALDKDEEGAEEYLDALLEERFATTAPSSACSRNRSHRGRRLRGATRSRRPEGLRAAAGRPMIEWSMDAFAGVEPVVRGRRRGAARVGSGGSGGGSGGRRPWSRVGRPGPSRWPTRSRR